MQWPAFLPVLACLPACLLGFCAHSGPRAGAAGGRAGTCRALGGVGLRASLSGQASSRERCVRLADVRADAVARRPGSPVSGGRGAREGRERAGRDRQTQAMPTPVPAAGGSHEDGASPSRSPAPLVPTLRSLPASPLQPHRHAVCAAAFCARRGGCMLTSGTYQCAAEGGAHLPGAGGAGGGLPHAVAERGVGGSWRHRQRLFRLPVALLLWCTHHPHAAGRRPPPRRPLAARALDTRPRASDTARLRGRQAPTRGHQGRGEPSPPPASACQQQTCLCAMGELGLTFPRAPTSAASPCP